MKYTVFLTTFFLSSQLIFSQNHTITKEEFTSLIPEFSSYAVKIDGQLSWFFRMPKFIRNKAAKALGYNKRTVGYLTGAYHCFKLKKITKNYITDLCKTNCTEFVNYTNECLSEITNNGKNRTVDVNQVAYIVHKRCALSISNLTTNQKNAAAEGSDELMRYQKNGLISADAYCKAIIKDLFLEFITVKRGITKKPIPAWLAWLF